MSWYINLRTVLTAIFHVNLVHNQQHDGNVAKPLVHFMYIVNFHFVFVQNHKNWHRTEGYCEGLSHPLTEDQLMVEESLRANK